MGPGAEDTELLANLEVILSTVRHQLGNSVNAIKVTLDVLNQNFDVFNDGKKKDYLERGSQLLARQQLLIEAMKSYSRFDVREQGDIDVVAFWERIRVRALTRVEGTDIILEERANLTHGTLQGNLMALDTITANLLDNAVDAVEQEEEPRIELEAVTSGERFILTIRDNGRGIAASDLPRIRIPLFSTKPGKAGMGLSIAHKLLAKMGGGMTIESTQAQGTCVRISLRTT
jgi:two-component system C4-dicarboxylate transport sensor histidine kinase DctB